MGAASPIKLIGGDYHYQPPPIPRDEKEIIGHQLKKKDQKWHIPREVLQFRDLSYSQKKIVVEKERERWENGVYFMNNGVPTYLNGPHYDYLAYGYFDFGRPAFWESQRHDFFFDELCKKDKKSYGGDIIKPRRYGLTSIEISLDIYEGISGYDRHVGLISNENRKTIRSLFSPLVEAFIRRPKYLRPNFYAPSGKKPRKELLFQSSRIADFNADDFGLIASEYLGGWIIPGTTTVIAFDGLKIHKLTADEIWKWKQVSPLEFWGIHKKCLEDGGEIIGKAKLLSTMGDSDDYIQAIKDGVTLWRQSDPNVRDLNGYTLSGLYAYFIPAMYALRAFTYGYGDINLDQAETYIRNSWANLAEGTKEYVFERRRMPITIEDALLGADFMALFDNVRLGRRRDEIVAAPIHEKPYVRGVLDMAPKSKIVRFEPDASGIWEVSHLPFTNQAKNIDLANRFIKRMKKVFPPVNPEGAIGYDPVMFADVDTSSGKKSEAAIIVRQKFDYFGSGWANLYNAMALWRPEDPDDAHFELLKACLFWAYPAMIERNCMGNCKKEFIKHGADSFLLKSKKDNIVGMYMDNTVRNVKEGINKFVAYTKKPRHEEETDYVELIPFERLINQAMPFQVTKTKTSDAFMANILCDFGLDQILETNVSDRRTSGLKNMAPWAKRV